MLDWHYNWEPNQREQSLAVPKFTRRSYFNAAQQHRLMADRLLNGEVYFFAHDFTCVAVEEILRALSRSHGEIIDSSHSIEYWAEKSGLQSIRSDGFKVDIRSSINAINSRWRANQRYYTYNMIDADLESARVGNIRGDRGRYSCRRLFELQNWLLAWEQIGGCRRTGKGDFRARDARFAN